MIPIPNVIEKIVENKTKQIKRYPCKSIRASSLGYFVPMLNGCVRRGVLEQTSWSEKELHNVWSQFIFDEGHHQEKQVLKEITDAGFDIIEQQTPFEWREHNITGSIDGKLSLGSEHGRTIEAIPLEVKSMHPAIFDSVHTFEDFKKKPWTRAYMGQITVYMLMDGKDRGVFFLKNKSNGQIKQINVNLDYELGEACLKTAEEINKHIKENTLPPMCDDRDVCMDCPFKLKCHPDMKMGAELKIADDPSLERKIERFLEIDEARKEADKLWDTITPKAKESAKEVGGELNVLVGKYHLTGKTGKNGSFRLKVEVV